MKNKLIILIVLFAGIPLYSQSFEGTMGEFIPVWLDLSVPSGNGAVTGTYFYKKHGGEIKLNGTKDGSIITLSETNNKQQITGTFILSNFGDSLKGTWEKPGGKKQLKIILFKTDPAYKKFALIPSSEKLLLMNGNTLYSNLEEYSGDGYNDGNDQPLKGLPGLNYYYTRKNILSTGFHWSYMGAYPSYGSVYHTFDLSTKGEIDLWNEVNEKFGKFLNDKIEIELKENRARVADSEWVETFKDFYSSNEENKDKTLDYYFTAFRDPATIKTYYFDEYSLHVVIDGYYEFPHVILAMDMFCHIVIPYNEFKQYLKKESILNRL